MGSSDPLDFRHHNYKAMRKVRHNPHDPGKGSRLSQFPFPPGHNLLDCHHVPTASAFSPFCPADSLNSAPISLVTTLPPF